MTNGSPEQCTTLAEVRAEIDAIDEEVIRLLGQRAGFVKAAARFKNSEAEVAAPDRLASMLRVRREWAERAGLSADVIEQIYRDLVSYFIRCEREHWQSQSPPAPLP
jgi:isochorismate pyruvate lyase